MSGIIEKAKEKFQQMIKDHPEDPWGLANHVPEMEKWTIHLLKKYPEADSEVVFLAAWLHDIGHYPISDKTDHAIIGEERSRKFLAENNYDSKRAESVLHCVRSHRCKDVMPETLEAKIIAFCDSASHMTDQFMYLQMANDDKLGGQERVLPKLDRDYRDLAIFPELQKEWAPLYEAWRTLLQEYDKKTKSFFE